jgi:hypothetical protein
VRRVIIPSRVVSSRSTKSPSWPCVLLYMCGVYILRCHSSRTQGGGMVGDKRSVVEYVSIYGGCTLLSTPRPLPPPLTSRGVFVTPGLICIWMKITNYTPMSHALLYMTPVKCESVRSYIEFQMKTKFSPKTHAVEFCFHASAWTCSGTAAKISRSRKKV